MNGQNAKNHPLQTNNWAEFRKKMGVEIIQNTEFVLSIHKISHLPWTIGYLPKGPLPTKEMLVKLQEIGKREKCIFIQLEPNVIKEESLNILISQYPNIYPSAHPLFTRYTFVLDLTKSEEELLKTMHPKTRYNIKIAQKHNVKVVEDNSSAAFETYLKLTFETTRRQGFYAHTEKYHRLQWQTLHHKTIKSQLSSHLLLAKYQEKILVAWIVFIYKDILYYPYGASSTEHRETMASNLMMWETIRFGKKLGLKKFDMWGAMGPNPDPKDPWYGFHRFKQGYGPKLVEFVGSYDLIINPILYQLYKIADKIRWTILKITKHTS